MYNRTTKGKIKMTKELKNKLDQMVNKIESMPHNTLQEIRDKYSAAHFAIEFLIRTLPDFDGDNYDLNLIGIRSLQVDGIHYQTLEQIMIDMDEREDIQFNMPWMDNL